MSINSGKYFITKEAKSPRGELLLNVLRNLRGKVPSGKSIGDAGKATGKRLIPWAGAGAAGGAVTHAEYAGYNPIYPGAINPETGERMPLSGNNLEKALAWGLNTMFLRNVPKALARNKGNPFRQVGYGIGGVLSTPTVNLTAMGLSSGRDAFKGFSDLSQGASAIGEASKNIGKQIDAQGQASLDNAFGGLNALGQSAQTVANQGTPQILQSLTNMGSATGNLAEGTKGMNMGSLTEELPKGVESLQKLTDIADRASSRINKLSKSPYTTGAVGAGVGALLSQVLRESPAHGMTPEERRSIRRRNLGLGVGLTGGGAVLGALINSDLLGKG